KETIQRLVGSDTQRNGLVAIIVAQAKPEEIAHWRLDAGSRFPVPVSAQHERFQMLRIGAGDREPDVRDDSRAVDLEQRDGLSTVDLLVVGVRARSVVAGGPSLCVFLRLGKVREPGLRVLRGGGKSTGQRQQNDGEQFHRKPPGKAFYSQSA